TGIPKLFRAIKLMEERLDTFETVRDLYFRDLRRPVTSPVPSTSLLSGSAQTLASVAALNVTLSVYGLSASKDETKQFEQDGTAAKARGLLLTWRQEHGDNLESFIEAQMTRAIVALDRTRKRLERLKQVKGFSNLDLASYDDTRPRA